ncbi:hypothetical protein ANDA3_3897 [plant metagenome]|uniref:Uncharacterized protein n=1 Tax=plant metagenome TaxID=1297885 RepID=A0A484QAW5_9ZZZZ
MHSVRSRRLFANQGGEGVCQALLGHRAAMPYFFLGTQAVALRERICKVGRQVGHPVFRRECGQALYPRMVRITGLCQSHDCLGAEVGFGQGKGREVFVRVGLLLCGPELRFDVFFRRVCTAVLKGERYARHARVVEQAILSQRVERERIGDFHGRALVPSADMHAFQAALPGNLEQCAEPGLAASRAQVKVEADGWRMRKSARRFERLGIQRRVQLEPQESGSFGVRLGDMEITAQVVGRGRARDQCQRRAAIVQHHPGVSCQIGLHPYLGHRATLENRAGIGHGWRGEGAETCAVDWLGHCRHRRGLGLASRHGDTFCLRSFRCLDEQLGGHGFYQRIGCVDIVLIIKKEGQPFLARRGRVDGMGSLGESERVWGGFLQQLFRRPRKRDGAIGFVQPALRKLFHCRLDAPLVVVLKQAVRGLFGGIRCMGRWLGLYGCCRRGVGLGCGRGRCGRLRHGGGKRLLGRSRRRAWLGRLGRCRRVRRPDWFRRRGRLGWFGSPEGHPRGGGRFGGQPSLHGRQQDQGEHHGQGSVVAPYLYGDVQAGCVSGGREKLVDQAVNNPVLIQITVKPRPLRIGESGPASRQKFAILVEKCEPGHDAVRNAILILGQQKRKRVLLFRRDRQGRPVAATRDGYRHHAEGLGVQVLPDFPPVGVVHGRRDACSDCSGRHDPEIDFLGNEDGPASDLRPLQSDFHEMRRCGGVESTPESMWQLFGTRGGIEMQAVLGVVRKLIAFGKTHGQLLGI